MCLPFHHSLGYRRGKEKEYMIEPRNNILCNVIVIVKMTKEGRLPKKKRMGKNVERIIETYPVLISLVMEASRIMSIKPILCRMGKGEGKLVDVYCAYSQNDVILHAYVPKDKMGPLIQSMKEQGIFNTSALSVLIYYI